MGRKGLSERRQPWIDAQKNRRQQHRGNGVSVRAADSGLGPRNTHHRYGSHPAGIAGIGRELAQPGLPPGSYAAAPRPG